MTSTWGDITLQVVVRHMRRILRPCDMEAKQDALLLNDDSNKVQPSPRLVSSTADVSDRPPVGEA